MTNLKPSLTKKHKANLVYAHKWFSRAQKDFHVFKQLVPFDKSTRKVVRCTDPALAVYLLQQSIEKATKAVAAATGKYPYGRLKSHGHNSLAMLLDFYRETLQAMGGVIGIETIFKGGFGLDVQEGLNKIENIKMEAAKGPRDRKKGETLYREQFAMISAVEIDRILDMLLLLRNLGFIGVPKSIFGPHSKVSIDESEINASTPEDLVSSFLETAGEKLNLPQLSESQMKALSALVGMFSTNVTSEKDKTEETIIIERDTERQLGQWSLLALMLLAAITFPHESTSRYPGPRKKKTPKPAGCEDYNKDLGIVNRLGRMGYITMLAIDELKPELEAIAAFFPIIEPDLIRKSNDKGKSAGN